MKIGYVLLLCATAFVVAASGVRAEPAPRGAMALAVHNGR